MSDALFITGNITSDPEAVTGLDFEKTRFSIAIDNGNKRDSDEKKEATFIPVEVTGYAAANALASLKKGMRITVRGKFRGFDTTATVNGAEKNIKRLAFDGWEVFTSLRYGTVNFTKSEFKGGNTDSAPAVKAAPAAKKPAAKAAPAAASTGGW